MLLNLSRPMPITRGALALLSLYFDRKSVMGSNANTYFEVMITLIKAYEIHHHSKRQLTS